MSATFKLPPSERDFEIFFAVVFQSVSTRRVAELHQISQTRVRQVVTLVGDWVADNLPDWGEVDLKKQVRLAQHVAANRLEHQYEQAMLYWNAEGDPKHLRQAARITVAQARLGVVAGRVHALAAKVTAGPSELGDNFPSGVEWAPPTADDLVTRVPPGNAMPRGSSLAAAETRQEPRGSGFPGGSLGTSYIETDYGRRDACPTPSPVGDCSPFARPSAGSESSADCESDASDSPETLIERERRQRLNEVEASAAVERRLLTLIEREGEANPEKVAELTATLARVRQRKATAELRLSRFIPGVHVEPLNEQGQEREAHGVAWAPPTAGLTDGGHSPPYSSNSSKTMNR